MQFLVRIREFNGGGTVVSVAMKTTRSVGRQWVWREKMHDFVSTSVTKVNL